MAHPALANTSHIRLPRKHCLSSFRESTAYPLPPNALPILFPQRHRTSSSRKRTAHLSPINAPHIHRVFSRSRKFLLFSTDEASASETKVQLAAPPRVALEKSAPLFPIAFKFAAAQQKTGARIAGAIQRRLHLYFAAAVAAAADDSVLLLLLLPPPPPQQPGHTPRVQRRRLGLKLRRQQLYGRQDATEDPRVNGAALPFLPYLLPFPTSRAHTLP